MQIEWLEGLETKVREAVDRLADLREENRQLNARVEELETELAAGTPGPAMDAADAAADSSAELAEEREQAQELRRRLAELQDQLDAQASQAETAQAEWERERDEIRGRVETLTRRLEELLGL